MAAGLAYQIPSTNSEIYRHFIRYKLGRKVLK